MRFFLYSPSIVTHICCGRHEHLICGRWTFIIRSTCWVHVGTRMQAWRTPNANNPGVKHGSHGYSNSYAMCVVTQLVAWLQRPMIYLAIACTLDMGVKWSPRQHFRATLYWQQPWSTLCGHLIFIDLVCVDGGVKCKFVLKVLMKAVILTPELREWCTQNINTSSPSNRS